MPRLYEILWVEKEATQEQIKEAFKKKMRELQLQKAELDGQEYSKLEKQLREANEVLSNKGRRKEYDDIKPVTCDFGTATNEILELQKYFDEHVKTLAGDGNIPSEKGYSSKITGFNEMQVTFRSPAEMEAFIEKAAAKFPSAGIVKTDEKGNKQYQTFADIVKEKREKAEKEQKSEHKQEVSRSSSSPFALPSVGKTPTLTPGGGGK